MVGTCLEARGPVCFSVSVNHEPLVYQMILNHEVVSQKDKVIPSAPVSLHHIDLKKKMKKENNLGVAVTHGGHI